MSSVRSPQATWRFRPRFRLRTFLVLVTLTAGLFGNWIRTAHEQRKGVEWVDAQHGTVAYELPAGDDRLTAAAGRPAILPWGGGTLGIDYFATARCVVLDYPVDDLSGLSPLARLEVLNVRNAEGIGDAGPLQGMTELKSLALVKTHLRDLTPLSNLTNLRELAVESSPLEDLAPLTNLTRLESLGLNDTRVRELAPLRDLTRLRYLGLRSTRVWEIHSLAAMIKLEVLDLHNSDVRDLTPLEDLIALRVLYLGRTRVLDVQSLAGLHRLELVCLDHTEVSDIAVLAQAPRLRYLSVIGTRITVQQAADFRQRRPHCELVWESSAVRR
jgi:hypothetical protein